VAAIRAKVASTSASVSDDEAAAEAGRASRSLAPPTPMRPCRGVPDR
jgi:hypothetical protein